MQAVQSRSTFDRFVDAVLDVDGEIYGDEQERLRWYEGITVAASVQWVVIPWALAALAIIDGDRFGPALWTVAAVFLLPVYLMVIHTSRRRVRTVSLHSRKVLISGVLFHLPLPIMAVALLWPDDAERAAPFIGGVVGGTVGVVLAATLTYLNGRRKRSRGFAGADVDEDGPGATGQ